MMVKKELEKERIVESTNKKCVCEGCGHERKPIFGVPCNEIICPKCEGLMKDK